MTGREVTAVVPQEGVHVLHLFYRIEHGQWSTLNPEEQIAAKTAFTELVQEISSTPDTQLLVFAMVSPKADLGFMLLTPDLQTANAFEKRLALSLGPDVLTPVYSFFSLTEQSEYTTSDEEYAATLVAEEKLERDTPPFQEKMAEFSKRMAKYRKDKLYPLLPIWEVFCFYPMSKRRG